MVPVMLFLKCNFITLPLFIGGVFFNLKISWKEWLGITLVGEIVFIVAFTTKFIWFYFNSESIDLLYYRYFTPLSLINLFNLSKIQNLFIYPLQTLNLFELIYWLVLSYLISMKVKISFWKSFEFVLSTYGVGLFIWVVFISFLILNFS
jgi:hypothetical protein